MSYSLHALILTLTFLFKFNFASSRLCAAYFEVSRAWVIAQRGWHKWQFDCLDFWKYLVILHKMESSRLFMYHLLPTPTSFDNIRYFKFGIPLVLKRSARTISTLKSERHLPRRTLTREAQMRHRQIKLQIADVQHCSTRTIKFWKMQNFMVL